MRWWWGPLCIRPTCWVGFNSASSLKQHSAGRHVAPLGHIILIPSLPVFALSPWCCVLSGEATNANSSLVWPIRRLEPTIHRTWGEHANHYTTDAIPRIIYDTIYSELSLFDWNFDSPCKILIACLYGIGQNRNILFPRAHKGHIFIKADTIIEIILYKTQ